MKRLARPEFAGPTDRSVRATTNADRLTLVGRTLLSGKVDVPFLLIRSILLILSKLNSENRQDQQN